MAGVEIRVKCIDNVVSYQRIGQYPPLTVGHGVAFLEIYPCTLRRCDDPFTETRCVQSSASAWRPMHMRIDVPFVCRPTVALEVPYHASMSHPGNLC